MLFLFLFLVQIEPRRFHLKVPELVSAVLFPLSSFSHPEQPVGESQGIGKVNRQYHHGYPFIQKPFQKFPNMDAD